MDWLIELVGKGYSAEGRTPDEGFCCSGLVHWIQTQRGIKLSDSALGWGKTGTIHRPGEDVQRYDMLCFVTDNDEGLVDHLGVAVDGLNFIHAGRIYGGVVCQPLAKYRFGLEAVVRFEVGA